MNAVWYFKSITWQSYVTFRVILCREAVCGLDFTCLITISFALLLRGKERPCHSDGSIWKTSVQHFLPQLTQHSKTFTSSEEVHNIPSETGLFCWPWIREKCLSLSRVGLRMSKMLHYRFVSTKSTRQVWCSYIWCYYILMWLQS